MCKIQESAANVNHSDPNPKDIETGDDDQILNDELKDIQQELKLEVNNNSNLNSNLNSNSNSTTNWKGLLYVAIANLLFSLMGLCVSLNAGRIPPFQMSFVRGLIQFLLSILILYFIFPARQKTDPTLTSLSLSYFFGPRKHLLFLFLRGACGSIATLLYYFAM
eukprot:TRINITY_DN9427_c0_g1_i1.p1 TRINITY_DN9427_c0_g1~~TRINITY_DN9427_c0_g1_i1.p1  ORF type:complete len:164 (-),score=29.68 TRINITY_DN9427_c0_g1_i1:169-660(-)